MECSQQVRLEIADGDVYPGKPFVHPFRRSHTAFMLLGLSQDPQCHQAIRAGGLPRKQMTLGELADVLGGYRMGRFHGDESCFLPTTFDGYQDRCFSFRTTPALASRPSPAYESVVQLHEAVNQRVKIASFGGKTASNITTRPSHNHRIYHAYPVDSPDHYR